MEATPQQLKALPPPLLAWYDENRRVLPWREQVSPYRTWVSEIMLQQTRVTAVLPYFDRFMAALPTVAALADAPEQQLMLLWQGLGYYSRARNLQKAAQVIMTRHGGVFPDTYEGLTALPGVGDYTAGAIASIAFGQPVPAVDGNVLRLAARLTGCDDNVLEPKTRARFRRWMAEVIPSDRPGAFNQALMDLGATDEQLDCPMLFCCGRDGTASLDPDVPGTDLVPLFDTLLSTIKPPEGDPEAPFQMLVSSVDYNEFVGRIGIGRIQNGVAKVGEEVVVCDWHNPDLKMRGRLTKLYDFQANGRQPCDNITAGDIVAFSGLPDVTIGNTLCAPSQVEPLPFVKINDPTVEMTFSVNDSPLAGREGKYVTSRQIRDRLQKELLKDVALKVEDSPTTDSFRVMGRGEMHLSILIETMRREGYELQVSPPHVLTKVIDGKTYEPMEHVVIDVPSQYQGAVMTGLGQRKAILQQMESLGSDRVRLEFRMPSRGLFGYRNQFLTDTHGEGIINQIFDGYDVWAGMIANRSTGSLVSFETGEAVTYGLFNAQQRGTLLVGAGEKVYEGMVIGYTSSGEDVDVNVCKTKHLTNTRASGSDDALRLIPISKLSLEGCLEFLAQDELLEVTPENLRIRKQILNHEQRMKAKSKMK